MRDTDRRQAGILGEGAGGVTLDHPGALACAWEATALTDLDEV